jgi:flagellum-specific ATP synthase
MLDGHIFLSRRLANRGHFPAIDVLESLSRCAAGLFSSEEEQVLRQARACIAAHEDAQEAITSGLHRKGQNPAADRVVEVGDGIMRLLSQRLGDEVVSQSATLQQIRKLLQEA